MCPPIWARIEGLCDEVIAAKGRLTYWSGARSCRNTSQGTKLSGRSVFQVAHYIRARIQTSERGASLVEYALLAALIAMVCLVAITYFGNATGNRLSSSGSSIVNAG